MGEKWIRFHPGPAGEFFELVDQEKKKEKKKKKKKEKKKFDCHVRNLKCGWFVQHRQKIDELKLN